MRPTTSHVVVALDATRHDDDVLDVADQLAATTGVAVAVVLPRTRAVADRLGAFATSEDLAPADAAEAYAERMTDRLRDHGVPAVAASLATDDASTAIAWYVRRHRPGLVLVAGDTGRRRLIGRPTVAERLAHTSVAPLLVVPTASENIAVM